MKNHEPSDAFLHTNGVNLKRKWYYGEENALNSSQTAKTVRKSVAMCYDYENYHPNHQIASPSIATSLSPISVETNTTTTYNDVNMTAKIIDASNEMELNESVEYVNILYENNLLSSVENPIVTEPNYINFDTNWNNADILDLDQRNFYYETATVTADHHHHQQQQVQSLQHHNHTDQIYQQAQQQPNETLSDEINHVIIQEHLNIPTVNGPTTTNNSSPSQDDSEDKNLSWLYNFKLNELPHLSPEVNRTRTETAMRVDEIIQEATANEVEENDIVVGENIVIENAPKLPKKPPFTYTELIEYALEDKGELTVSGIYNWISDRFPFYKSNDDRWKNSVRHNLSINPHFRKGNKAPQGAGHLWVISTRDSEANILAWEHKKQRLDLFFKMEKCYPPSAETFCDNQLSIATASSFDETSVAVANITNMLDENQPISMSPEPNKFAEEPTIHNTSLTYQNVIPTSIDTISSDDELKKCAGEILNGIKRTVEVQVVNPPNHFYTQESSILGYFEDCFPDYLNPVPKDQIVRESGLRSSRHNNNNNNNSHSEFGNDYFVTELDPIELGINMSTNAESEEVLFGDDFNLNYFGIVAGNNIMA